MKPKLHRIKPALLTRARELRHPMTRAERILWAHVRDRQLGGFKFRRQYPIGPYVPDFYCAECRLVVEVDGDVHAMQQERDEARTEWLNEHYYRVIRFSNDEVYHNLESVLESILNDCENKVSARLRG